MLHPALQRALHGRARPPAPHDAIDGHRADRQGHRHRSERRSARTPRSNPATYTGVFDADPRACSPSTPEARARGYNAGRFSFNVKGGRCEACEGDGVLRIEMHFLPDVFVTCEVCRGRRFNDETLARALQGLSIADVLDMTVEEALEVFAAIAAARAKPADAARRRPRLHASSASRRRRCRAARRSASSSRASSRAPTGRTLYILDEPTTGLHFDDVEKLLDVLNRLVDARQHRDRHRAQPRRHQDRATGSSISVPRAAAGGGIWSRRARPRRSPPARLRWHLPPPARSTRRLGGPAAGVAGARSRRPPSRAVNPRARLATARGSVRACAVPRSSGCGTTPSARASRVRRAGLRAPSQGRLRR